MRSHVALLAVILASSSVARAEAPGTPPADERSPVTALALSLGVTTAGAVTAIAGNGGVAGVGMLALLIGPSTGRWYAGDPSLAGLGLRTLGGLAMFYGFAEVLAHSDCDPEDVCDDSAGSTGGALMLSGFGLWIGSTIYDIAVSPRSANDWNARHAIALTPARLTPDATGLVLSGRF